ncbi:hypothetical protein [Deinococcus aquaedulcis]|uniref:hypothetical protein n=1 Tax=Deinococcus aquaedulcis TaxID=2840455 RepID=UPI001C82E8C8|nr:hypothetical protein [Deinococcus aquaedulcis]
MTITPSRLVRSGGGACAAAGLLFLGVQTLHPPEVLAAVTTPRWAAVHALTLLMALAGLLGLTAVYTQQVRQSGWPGLAGFLLLGLWLVLVAAFTFVETFVLPLLVTDAPGFVESFLRIFSGHAGPVNLGALAAAAPLSGALYMLGGLLLGLATWRAGVLPRGAGLLMMVAAFAPLMVLPLPHPLHRLAALPMGLSLLWLGVALWLAGRAGDAPLSQDQAGLQATT